MRYSARRSWPTGLAVAALLVVGIQVLAQTGAGATPNTSTAVITVGTATAPPPATVAAGSTTAPYFFTLTNTSGATGSVVPLGSALVTLPAGWSQPTFGTLPSGWTIAQNAGGTWCLSSTGTTGLGSGQSVAVPYTESAQSTAGAATFTTAAFVGPSCTLGITGPFPYTGDQPIVNVDTLAYTRQTLAGVVSKALTPGFTVAAEKADGSTDAAFTRPIKLAIGSNPGVETSFTSATQTPSGGSTTFSSVVLNKVASKYTLVASSDGSAGATSQSIYIAPSANAVVCPPNQSCDTGLIRSATKSPTAADARGDIGPATDVVSIAVGDTAGISCAGLPTNPAPLDVFVADFNRHLTLKVVYDRDQDNDAITEFTRPLAQTSWTPVCFQGSNNPQPILLPPCTTTDANGFPGPEPCIAAEYTNGHGSPENMAVLSLNPDPDPHVLGP